MASGPAGGPRHPGLVLLFSVLSLGFFVYYWMWRAFAEVFATRDRDPWPSWPAWGLAALQLGGIVLLAIAFPEFLIGPAAPFTTAFWVSLTSTILLLGLELAYLARAQRKLRGILAAHGIRRADPIRLLIIADVALVLTFVPALELLMLVLGLGAFALWLYHVQSAINAFWTRPTSQRSVSAATVAGVADERPT